MKRRSAAKQSAGMPRFHKLSPEMERWSAMLAEELAEWPGVTTKPMFGFTGFYRSKTMFAAVPKSRALGNANSVIFKLPPTSKWRDEAIKDSRIQPGNMDTHKWFPLRDWLGKRPARLPPLVRARFSVGEITSQMR